MEKTIFEIEGRRITMVLQEVCEFIVDCPHSTAPDEGEGYPLIRTPNIGKGRLKLDNVQRVSKEIYDKRNKRAVPQVDDIIFAREAPAGNAAIICEGQEVCLGQRTVLIRPDKEKVYPQFLVYYMLAPQQQYELLGTANGATVAHVNIPIIENLPIELPSIEQQIKIAGIISTHDNLIENNQKQIKLLEEAAQRLYKEWFVDLRFPGYEDVAAVDGMPEGWCLRCVSDFGKVITGKTPSTTNAQYYGGNIPFVTIPDMHGHVFPLTTEKTLTKEGANSQKSKYLPANSVMVSCIATVGLVNIVYEPCQTNQQINSVILDNEYDLYFFFETMKCIKMLLDGVGSNGATMTNVNKSKFEKITILYPTKELVRIYYKHCKLIFDKILSLSKIIESAKQARDRLLPKLMSGELEV